MEALIAKAAKVVPIERLWINPDCGLKTRQWQEVRPALEHMVNAARAIREKV
jgi:5-methyltetrahydropteroyltriglutamate--homocysteine methyltransferase